MSARRPSAKQCQHALLVSLVKMHLRRYARDRRYDRVNRYSESPQLYGYIHGFFSSAKICGVLTETDVSWMDARLDRIHKAEIRRLPESLLYRPQPVLRQEAAECEA